MEVNQQQLKDVLSTFDAAGAISILNQDKQSPGLLNGKLRIQLSYIRMKSLSADRFLNLASESILTAYQIPYFDFYQYFVEYIENYDYVPDEIQICEGMAKILLNCEEALGVSFQDSDGRKQDPLVTNWIKFFQESFPTKGDIDPLLILKFVNSSATKEQTPEVKSILKSILAVFSYCQKILKLNELLKEPIDPDKFPENFEPMDITMALAKIEKDEIQSSDTKPREIDISENRASRQIKDQIQGLDSLQKKINSSQAKSQDKRGLVFDTPTNVDMDEIANESKKVDQAQQKIANKLEELKQRKDQKNNTKQE